MPFDPSKLEQVKSGFDASKFDAAKQETFGSKVNKGALGVVKTGLDIINAPFELVGEAIAAPIEQRKAILPTIFGGQGAENPISVVNKLLRAGAGALSGIPSGTPLASARAAYHAPRGILGTVEDTAMGLLLGKMAPEVLTAPADAALAGIAKAASTATKLASGAVKKGIRVALGPSVEAQTLAMNRPQDIARQTDFTGLSEKLAQTTNELSSQLEQLDNHAWDTLLKLKAEPRSKFLNILRGVKQNFVGTGKTKIGDADRKAAAQIESYIQRIKDIKQPGRPANVEQFLDQPQLKNIIQSIQKDANYSLPESDPVNMAVKAARAKIDQYLKGQNPEYEEAMKPVADATAAIKDTVKRFGLEYKTNEGFLPKKATVDALTRATKGKSPELDRTLTQLKNTTGIDFTDEAKLTAAKMEFDPGIQRTAGSRRAVAGGAIGAGAGTILSKALGLPPSIGATVGGAAGTGLGLSADYYGGSTAKSILNMLSKGKTGVGNVLAAVNAKTEGTPLQDIIKRMLAGKPALAPLLSGSR